MPGGDILRNLVEVNVLENIVGNEPGAVRCRKVGDFGNLLVWLGFHRGLNCVLEGPVAGDSAYTQTGFNYILDIS